MRLERLLRIVYVVLFCVGLIAVGILAFHRNAVERDMNVVDIVADYEDFSMLAKQLGLDETEVLSVMKDAGFTAVGLVEETLVSLSEQHELEFELYTELKKRVGWRELLPEEVVQFLESAPHLYTTVAVMDDEGLFQRMGRALKERYDDELYTLFSGKNMLGRQRYVVLLHAKAGDMYYSNEAHVHSERNVIMRARSVVVSSELEGIGLGFDEEKIGKILQAGMKIELRPLNYASTSNPEKLVKAFFEEVDRYRSHHINHVTFAGRSVLGWANDQEYIGLKEEMDKRGLMLSLVEASNQLGFIKQQGADELAERFHYSVIRLLSVPDYIQLRYNYLGYYEGPKEIENTLFRAITDRNIRSVYMRAFKESKLRYVEKLDEYAPMIQSLGRRLGEHGILIGEAKPMGQPFYSKWLYVFLSYGMMVAGVLLLRLVFSTSRKFELGILLLGLVGIPPAFYVAEDRMLVLLSFASTVLFPLLAFTVGVFYIRELMMQRKAFRLSEIIGRSILGFLLMIVIALIGGLFTGGYLSRVDYLVEAKHFTGVKLSLVLPLILSVFVYVMKMGLSPHIDSNTKYTDDVKALLRVNVTVLTLIICAVLGAVAYVYLARSGNTMSATLDAEILFRNFLENTLYVRPRNKEFLLAFPAIFVSLYLACKGYKRLTMPFIIVGVIGLSSIANTFCHTRTALYISIFRVLISAAISVAIGIAVILVLDLFHRLYLRLHERFAR